MNIRKATGLIVKTFDEEKQAISTDAMMKALESQDAYLLVSEDRKFIHPNAVTVSQLHYIKIDKPVLVDLSLLVEMAGSAVSSMNNLVATVKKQSNLFNEMTKMIDEHEKRMG
jgi:hypothetical protein